MNIPPPINNKYKINFIIKENISLKNAIKLYQEKEKLYKTSILKMKKYQSEYKQSFIKILNDYKTHENKIKQTYISYHKLLERHYKTNENRFIEENNSLNIELRQKNNIIRALTKKINNLNEKLNKTEFDFRYKNKKLEDEVILKDRKLNQLNESMFQLAKDTNDEIKLLRDEFNIYKSENKNNKTFRRTEGNYDSLLEKDCFDNTYYNNKNISLDKKIYKNQEFNYLTNKIYFLEDQNKNLKQKLIRKEKELTICNNLKNELLYDSKINNKYFYGFGKQNNMTNNIIFNNFEKKIEKLGKKINNLKIQYDESLIRHQNEIQNIKNTFQNKNSEIYINKNSILDKGESNNYNNEYFDNYDINEFQITNKINDEQHENYEKFQTNNIYIDDDEEIKDKYINSYLPQINTLD
jgi:hypothetical protein